jgi:zeta-carotene desaturase
LRRIGTESLLNFPEGLRVDYVNENGVRDVLRCPSILPAPMHLAWGILRLSGLSLIDKFDLWSFDRSMRRQILNGGKPPDLDSITVRQWLASMGVGERMQSRLFDPIAIGALNEHSERASALGFSQVLKEIFYGGEENSRLGLASVGLSELYTEQARAFIESRGGSVHLGQKIASIHEAEGLISEVVTDLGQRYSAEAVVSAMPPWALASIEKPRSINGPWASWKSVPIIGIHVWLDRPIFSEPFFGMLGTEIHWAFNKSALWNRRESGQYLSLVISGAHRYLDCTPQKIWETAHDELYRCFPEFAKAQVTSWSVIKEPNATPSPECGSNAWRPAYQSAIRNFFFAGDWTQTGLPATIESATASGHACAELILKGP